MKKNIAVAAACITFAVLIGNSVNVSAESIPVKKKQVQLLSGFVKNVAKIKPVQKKGPDVEVGLLSGQPQVISELKRMAKYGNLIMPASGFLYHGKGKI